MKRNDIQELKNKSAVELSKLLGEERIKLRGMKFDLSLGKVKNVKEVHQTKKLIARLATFLEQSK